MSDATETTGYSDLETELAEAFAELNLTEESNDEPENGTEEETEVPIEPKEPMNVTTTKVEIGDKKETVQVARTEQITVNLLMVYDANAIQPEFIKVLDKDQYLNSPFHRFKSQEEKCFGYYQGNLTPALDAMEKLFQSRKNITLLGAKREVEEVNRKMAQAIVENLVASLPENPRLSVEASVINSTNSVVNNTNLNILMSYKCDEKAFTSLKYIKVLETRLKKCEVKVRLTFAIPLQTYLVLDATAKADLDKEGFAACCYTQSAELQPALKKDRVALFGELNKGELAPHVILTKTLN